MTAEDIALVELTKHHELLFNVTRKAGALSPITPEIQAILPAQDHALYSNAIHTNAEPIHDKRVFALCHIGTNQNTGKTEAQWDTPIAIITADHSAPTGDTRQLTFEAVHYNSDEIDRARIAELAQPLLNSMAKTPAPITRLAGLGQQGMINDRAHVR